jgi:hypothetical protein
VFLNFRLLDKTLAIAHLEIGELSVHKLMIYKELEFKGGRKEEEQSGSISF